MGLQRARKLATLVVAVSALAGLAPAAAPAAPATLRTGFVDGVFSGDDAAQWLDRSTALNASVVRLDVDWSSVAPTVPGNTLDPGDPAYRFGPIDQRVTEAVTHGLDPVLDVVTAPLWATGADRPSVTSEGSWKPDPEALGAFATALARRYSGTYVPAGATQPLPRVRTYQAWNEPNLEVYLAPQWTRSADGRLRAFAPAWYRRMLNAFNAGIKTVDPSAIVVTAGTAPFGDPSGGNRMRPVRFWRETLCLNQACSDPAAFDVLSHHPYGVRGPQAPAFSAEDITVADFGRVRDLLRSAEDRGRVAPPRRHRIWSTEISWDTNPPDPFGISLERQAQWLTISLYQLWKAGVDTVVWFRIRDQDPSPTGGYGNTYQSGVVFADGRKKPSSDAIAFPFLTDPRRRVRAWGVAPRPGRVQIEQQRGDGTWRVVKTLTAGSGRVFLAGGSWRRGDILRAVQGTRSSRHWRVR